MRSRRRLINWTTPDYEPAVTFSTVRAAKGRKWPKVMILNVSDSVMPDEIDEDPLNQRVLFSGITRCTERLSLYVQADTGHGNGPRILPFLEPVEHLLAHDQSDSQAPLRRV